MVAEERADVELEMALETGSALLGVKSDQERTGWWRGCSRIAAKEKRRLCKTNQKEKLPKTKGLLLMYYRPKQTFRLGLASF